MLDIQKYIGKPKIVTTEVDSTTSRFEVQYLPRGFGHTFGNSIRRAILGYDFGSSITGLKIKGVPHKYETIDGVKETVIDIMLNMKKLRFKTDESLESQNWVSQRFKGVGKYTSSDLKLPAGIQLLNEDEYLFEITDSVVELIVDFRIEKGYGYYSIDYLTKREGDKDESEIGMFLIDNDFKAVNYVSYEVEEHIDDFTGSVKDKLNLEIKTISDKISPKETLTFAGEVISSYAKLFVFDESYIDNSAVVDYYSLEDGTTGNSSAGKEESLKTIPIDAIPLSERTRNAFIKNNILYVEDLEKKKKSELLSMKGVGRKAVEEISQSLKDIGRGLAG